MANLDCAIILAGGEGKRMKSNKPKVLSQVLFQPMLKWVVDAVLKADLENLCVVSGFMHECVENYLDELKEQEEQYHHICFAYQSERKGTAHAVMMADAFLKEHSGGDVLILNGDAPLVDEAVIRTECRYCDCGNAGGRNRVRSCSAQSSNRCIDCYCRTKRCR